MLLHLLSKGSGLAAAALLALGCELLPGSGGATPEDPCVAWAKSACGELQRCCREGRFAAFECAAEIEGACGEALDEAGDAARACLEPLSTCGAGACWSDATCADPGWMCSARVRASAIFCLGPGLCGDGECQWDEDPETCTKDCGFCGDGHCAPGEGAACPGDCPDSCVTCGRHLGFGGALCPGKSADLFDALMACICEGACAAACAPTACAGEAATPECGGCILDRDDGCGAAIFACADDF